jgi:hypothetical protein
MPLIHVVPAEFLAAGIDVLAQAVDGGHGEFSAPTPRVLLKPEPKLLVQRCVVGASGFSRFIDEGFIG